MAFTDKTRRKLIPLPQRGITAATGGTLTWDLPKAGLLAGIYLHVFADTSAAGWGAVSPLHAAACVGRIRLIANSGQDLINITGVGYRLLRWFQEDFRDASPSWGGDAGPAAGATYNLDMFLPVTINRRDPLGMIMLQNEATLLQLSVEIGDAVTVGGAGSTYDDFHVVPYLEVFSVPAKEEDWPPLSVAHQILEETRAVPAAGAFAYEWPRGNTYAQVLHGTYATGADFTDNFTAVDLTVNQSDRIWSGTVDSLNMEFGLAHGIVRPVGMVPIDFLGSSGLGAFGSARDMLYSPMVTEIATNFTMSAAGSLLTIRRQLVAMKG